MPESRLYAGIHILDVPYSADIPYSYSVPEEFAGSIHCGSLAVVPFGQGNRFKLGLVTSLADNTDANTDTAGDNADNTDAPADNADEADDTVG